MGDHRSVMSAEFMICKKHTSCYPHVPNTVNKGRTGRTLVTEMPLLHPESMTSMNPHQLADGTHLHASAKNFVAKTGHGYTTLAKQTALGTHMCDYSSVV